ncbi:MAG: heme-binding domain-containing protein, partial [Salibacteraceae bacterium]
GIQFISVDVPVKEMDKNADFILATNAPNDVASILKTSCYDCHSNETNYPWYSNIAPVSWWVKDHIKEGREELNFSAWGTFTEKRKAKKLHEIEEEVEEGEMPLSSYTITHSNASLSKEQKEVLITWVKYLTR